MANIQIVKRLKIHNCKLIISFIIVFIFVYSFLMSAYAEMSWEPIKFFKTYDFRDAACNDQGLFVSVGIDGMVKTSSDLTNWTLRESGTDECLVGCSYGNGKFVAVGLNGTIIYSSDGIKWSSSKLKETIDIDDVAWGNGKFIAVGTNYPQFGEQDQRYILSSTDGEEWKVILEDKGAFSWYTLKYINNMFITSNAWDKIAFSSDGIQWTIKDIGVKGISDITWDGEKYVAVGNDSKIYTSIDLSNWTLEETNINSGFFLEQIAKFNDKYFIEVSEIDRSIILSSTDLHNWDFASQRAYSPLNCFINNNDKLIAIGSNETTLQTQDGRNWSVSEKPHVNLLKVIWNGTNFLVLGNDGKVSLSKDGLSWKSYSSETQQILIDAVWTGNEYIALGVTLGENDEKYDIVKSSIYKSLDGIVFGTMKTKQSGT